MKDWTDEKMISAITSALKQFEHAVPSKETKEFFSIVSSQIGDIKSTLGDIKYIRRDLDDIKERLDTKFVTKDEFRPVKNIVYGMVTIILTAVIGAIVALVIRL